MINSLIRYLVIFATLMLLQVLVFNNIRLSGYVNPYVYIMFILLLPVEIPHWLLLTVSFFTGLTLDLFTSTPGMHAGASVAAGFTRPFVLRFISPRDGYEPGASPAMITYGFRWFLLFTVIIVGIHHFILFFFEVFRLTDFLRTLLRILLSTVVTTSFILVVEFYRKGR